MTDIGSWLKARGLEKYADAFAENDIGLDVLPELDREDLKDLGVSLGDGKRLLMAARALSQEPAPNAVDLEGETLGAPAVAKTRAAPERRQLTVMFADLVGSTELSQQLDPEELREINRAYQDAAKAAIERYGGFVARYMGDGVLAYFGYPQAHEDDAEGAVRSGLELAERIPSIRSQPPLAVRVGISTGAVVVGDLIGEGASQESAVVGETPNLAARLQGHAEPNTVVISEATQVLIAGLFELEALPPLALKGFSEAITAFRVQAELRGQSRFVARSGLHLSPFVGREEEFELLARRWTRAREGQGQVVLALGEPGIGKSRLLQQLHSELDAERHEGIFLQCSPYHEASALYPTISAFERVLQFAEIVEDAKRLEALERHLRQINAADEQSLGLLADLLSIKAEDRFRAVEVMDAAQRREQTLRALVQYVRKLAEHTPLLCAFEDVHWADPTTRELLGRLVEAVESTSALLIATTRPGFEAGWTDLAHVQVMSLSRLGAVAATQLLESAPGVKTLPEDVVGAVLNRAEGNPLFIEELTRTVVQSSVPVTDSGAIPATLQDSLMARVDATGKGKPVAQYAAIVGRSFDHVLLVETWGNDSTSLFEGLNALEQAGLVSREGAGELTRYSFKHALIRDAAYDSLLREDRKRLHARVAAALISLNPSIGSSQPELLAHHFTEAEEYEASIDYWLAAGKRASNGSAVKEALAILGRGLEVLERLPPSPSRDHKEFDIRVAMISPTITAMGQGSQGMQDAVECALTLSDRIGDTLEIFPVLFARCIYHGHRARYKEAMSLARDISRRARQQSDVVPRMVAHRALGFTHLCLGELECARIELRTL